MRDKEQKRLYDKAYCESEQGKAVRKKYHQSEKYLVGNRARCSKYYQSHKKERSKYMRKQYKQFIAIIHEIKSNGCAICGYNSYDGALDFHHTNPKDKLFGISARGMFHSNKLIADEINKCILLCANCHREVHKC